MSADDEKRDARAVDDALLRAFCAVQALCAGAIGVAYPAVVCALATWIFIFTGIVVARELTEKHIPDEARRRRVFGGCWAALWHLWLPCCLLNRWGYFSFHFPSWVYGSGTLLWALLSFYQRLLGLPWTARAAADRRPMPLRSRCARTRALGRALSTGRALGENETQKRKQMTPQKLGVRKTKTSDPAEVRHFVICYCILFII